MGAVIILSMVIIMGMLALAVARSNALLRADNEDLQQRITELSELNIANLETIKWLSEEWRERHKRMLYEQREGNLPHAGDLTDPTQDQTGAADPKRDGDNDG